MDIIRLINMSPASIHSINGMTDVKFSNGKIAMTPSEINIDRIIFLNVINSKNGLLLDIKKEYSIVHNYLNGLFSSGTLNTVFSNIRTDIVKKLFKTLPSNIREIMKEVDEGIMSAINEIYTITSIEAYTDMLTLDVRDTYELYHDDEIMAAVDRVKKEGTPESIAAVYDTIDEVIHKKYRDNNLGLSYIARTAKPKQVQHIAGVRGFVKDLNEKIYKYPIPYGYMEGLKDIVSYLIESKTAAIAIFHSTKSIEQSEWFAREAQVKAQAVRKLVYKDCKTKTNLLKIKIKKEGLEDFMGCLYKENLEDKEYRLVEDTSVIGKTIHIRHTGSCNLPNHDEVCIKCFGIMGVGVLPNTNIGAFCSVSLTENKTQGLLSFKHLMLSAKASKLFLTNTADKYMHYIDKDNIIKIRSKAIKIKGGYTLHIELPPKNIPALEADININDLDTVYSTQLSELKELTFVYLNKDNEEGEIEATEILKQKTPLSFSIDFIKYILQEDCKSVGNNDTIRISLDKWSAYAGNAILIPNTVAESSTKDLETFKDLVTKCKYEKEPSKPIEINSALLRLYSNMGHGDHLSLISTLMYSTTIDSSNHFKLGRADDKRICHPFRKCFNYASFSAIIGYGYLTDYMGSPEVLSLIREDHPLDVLITPEILNIE